MPATHMIWHLFLKWHVGDIIQHTLEHALEVYGFPRECSPTSYPLAHRFSTHAKSQVENKPWTTDFLED